MISKWYAPYPWNFRPKHYWYINLCKVRLANLIIPRSCLSYPCEASSWLPPRWPRPSSSSFSAAEALPALLPKNSAARESHVPKLRTLLKPQLCCESGLATSSLYPCMSILRCPHQCCLQVPPSIARGKSEAQLWVWRLLQDLPESMPGSGGFFPFPSHQQEFHRKRWKQRLRGPEAKKGLPSGKAAVASEVSWVQPAGSTWHLRPDFLEVLQEVWMLDVARLATAHPAFFVREPQSQQCDPQCILHHWYHVGQSAGESQILSWHLSMSKPTSRIYALATQQMSKCKTLERTHCVIIAWGSVRRLAAT